MSIFNLGATTKNYTASRRNDSGVMSLLPGQGASSVMITAAKRPIVLIVEDEFLLRMNAVEMIEQAGFDVIEVCNADEAITALENRSDIRVVFTDIQMPGSMDGLKLAAAVRGRWPPIKIIATSGRYVIREGDLPEGGLFLPKPYTSEAISSLLHEITGRV
jgi:CheY-like chemotaxis protein